MIKNERIYTMAQQGLFIDELAKHNSIIYCFFHKPLSNEKKLMDYKIEEKNIKLISIGYHTKIYFRILFNRLFMKNFKDFCKNFDAIIIRQPTPLLPYFSNLAKSKTAIILTVGDSELEVGSNQQHFIKSLLVKLYVKYFTKNLLRATKKSFMLVNNPEAFDKWSGSVIDIKQISTGLMKKEWLHKRKDTCQKNIINVLFTGRIEKQKGVIDIAKAVVPIIIRGYNIFFHVVGETVKGDNSLNKIKNIFQRNNLNNNLRVHGFLPFGEKLFDKYRKADIFITASTTYEGFPRTIYEALSHSLPVITTKIGGVPKLLSHRQNAMLCEPKNPLSLENAIVEIIEKKNLRRKIIKNGYTFSKLFTIENSVKLIDKQIKNWINSNNSNQ